MTDALQKMIDDAKACNKRLQKVTGAGMAFAGHDMERRRKEVAALMDEGMGVVAISRHLNATQSLISRDVKAIREARK